MMKQRITVEQLNELSDDQKERLREWWNPQEGDWYNETPSQDSVFLNINHSRECCSGDYCKHEENDGINVQSEYDKEGKLPLLSIGQMIELLSDFGESYREVIMKDFDYVTDLCDELWQAVKRLL